MIERKSLFNDQPAKFITVHIGCWALYIAYEIFTLYEGGNRLQPFYIYAIYYMVNISYFYVNAFLLKRSLLLKGRRRWRSVALIVPLFLFYNLTKLIIDCLISHHFYTIISSRLLRGLTSDIFRCGYFAILSFFYALSVHLGYVKEQNLMAENKILAAEKEKLALRSDLADTRMAFLAQQINPHLLFNTLSFIYHKVRGASSEAADCLVLLTDILRDNLTNTDADGKVSLNDEIDQIKKLIRINQYRFDNGLAIESNILSELPAGRIIPLVVFTLTENIFKHGICADASRPAKLEIIVSGMGRLIYHTHNFKKNDRENTGKPGIGLQNIRARLEHAYGGRYELLTFADKETFEVKLTIEL